MKGLVLAVTIAAAAVVASSAAAKPAVSACPRIALHDPYAVAAQFLSTAVQRRNVGVSYRLATPSLRGDRSCADWVGGKIPVRAFRQIDWSRSAYETVAGGEGQVVIRVLLYRPHAAAPKAFLMEIQRDASEPGWHVGYFAPDRWYRPKPAPALPSTAA